MFAPFPRKLKLREKRVAIQRQKVMKSRYMDRVSALHLRCGVMLVFGGWSSKLALWKNVPYFASIDIMCSDEGIVANSPRILVEEEVSRQMMNN